MSNDMIKATYIIAHIAIIEAIMLLYAGIKYGICILIIGIAWRELTDYANRKKFMRVTKPTREEKELIKKSRLDWRNWNVSNRDNISITIINKTTGTRRVLFK